MDASDQSPRKRLGIFDWTLIVSIASLIIAVVPRLPEISFGDRPIADLYNPVSKDLAGILMKIDLRLTLANSLILILRVFKAAAVIRP